MYTYIFVKSVCSETSKKLKTYCSCLICFIFEQNTTYKEAYFMSLGVIFKTFFEVSILSLAREMTPRNPTLLLTQRKKISMWGRLPPPF